MCEHLIHIRNALLLNALSDTHTHTSTFIHTLDSNAWKEPKASWMLQFTIISIYFNIYKNYS